MHLNTSLGGRALNSSDLILHSLLTDRNATDERTSERLAHAGFSLLDRRFFVVLDDSSHTLTSHRLTALVWHLNRLFPEAMTGAFDGRPVMLLSFREQDGPEKLLQPLRSFVEENRLHAGISHFFNALKMPHFYEQAVQSLILGCQIPKNPGARVHLFQDFPVIDMLRLICQNGDLEDYWDQFNLQLSFRILIYLNLYRPDRVQKDWDRFEAQRD